MNMIKSGEVGTAQEFRNGLKLMGDARPKVVNKLVKGKYNFEDVISTVEVSGNANEVFKRLNHFRDWMNKEETQKEIRRSKGEGKRKIDYEIKKLSSVFSKFLG